TSTTQSVPQEQNLETDGLANKLDATKIASKPPTFGSQDSLHGDWLVETIQALAQDHGSARDKAVVHPFGIQTSMNVDILAPNRMRFRDEDDPSSLDSSQLMVVSQGHDTPGEKVAQMAYELSLAKKD
ncbi:hypothetical protein SESBI_51327, partial [Sesbania bispinosa]